jgi:hypothetical protein
MILVAAALALVLQAEAQPEKPYKAKIRVFPACNIRLDGKPVEIDAVRAAAERVNETKGNLDLQIKPSVGRACGASVLAALKQGGIDMPGVVWAAPKE